MFRRRDRPSLTDRARQFIWPRAGWRRTWRYLLYRLYRLHGSPRQVALGFACGAFVSFTPLFGLHYFTSVLAAWFLRCNVIAAFLGANLGFVYPLVLLWAYHLGTAILGTRPVRFPQGHGMATILHDFWSLFLPVLIGSIPVGLGVAVVSFTVVYWAVTAYRRLRQRHPVTLARASRTIATEDSGS